MTSKHEAETWTGEWDSAREDKSPAVGRLHPEPPQEKQLLRLYDLAARAAFEQHDENLQGDHGPTFAQCQHSDCRLVAVDVEELLRPTGEIAPPAPPWQPIETAPSDRRVLVTNNCSARDAYGQMSHVWVGFALPSEDGKTYVTYDDCDQKVMGLTHWMPLPPAPPQAPEQEP